MYVLDTEQGEIIGQLENQGRPEVAWAGDPPLLLVATGQALNAFRIVLAN